MSTTISTTTTPNGQVVQTQTTLSPAPAGAVEIAQNSQGQPQVTIKLSGDDPEQTAQRALALYRRLTQALETGAAALAPESSVLGEWTSCFACPCVAVPYGADRCPECGAAPESPGHGRVQRQR